VWIGLRIDLPQRVLADQRIADYANISHYLKALYEVPGVKETVDLDHIRTHYYWSHTGINPTRIIPIGPELPFLS
jgi:putative glutathione S-transferase